MPYFPPCPTCGSPQTGHNVGTGAIDAPLAWCPNCAAKARRKWRIKRAISNVFKVLLVSIICSAILVFTLVFKSRTIQLRYANALFILVVISFMLPFVWAFLNFLMPTIIWSNSKVRHWLMFRTKTKNILIWLAIDFRDQFRKIGLVIVCIIIMGVVGLIISCYSYNTSFLTLVSKDSWSSIFFNNKDLYKWFLFAVIGSAVFLAILFRKFYFQRRQTQIKIDEAKRLMDLEHKQLPRGVHMSQKIKELLGLESKLNAQRYYFENRQDEIKKILIWISSYMVLAFMGYFLSK